MLLALETSNPSADGPPPGPSVALRAPSGTTLVEPLSPHASPPAHRRGHDDDLLPAIDRLFTRAHLAPRDLAGGAVAVSIGPGGFTGLRIACAAAKLLAESVGAHCIAVPTAHALIRRIDPDLFRAGPVAVSLAAKADTTWLHIFESPTTSPIPARLISAAEFPSLAAAHNLRTLISDRFLPEPIRAECGQRGLNLVPPTFDAAAVLEAAETLPRLDPLDLLPLYPREPEAVTLWRARPRPA
ncbi:MAG: tRNA (adenosine(37)-N6)-threonylcarbamoyltransferase complex dimerization subunit type 1 TsaB [Phycisphaerales bacterium]